MADGGFRGSRNQYLLALAADSSLPSQPSFQLPDNAIRIENDVPNGERARTMMNER
ncbi:hypothetical protein ACLBWT_06180 [Paenibacillus sp. D51F]